MHIIFVGGFEDINVAIIAPVDIGSSFGLHGYIEGNNVHFFTIGFVDKVLIYLDRYIGDVFALWTVIKVFDFFLYLVIGMLLIDFCFILFQFLLFFFGKMNCHVLIISFLLDNGSP